MESTKKLRVLILTHGGLERLIALLVKNENVEIVGVYLEQPVENKRSFKEKLKRSFKYDGYLATVLKFFAIISGTKTDGRREFERAIDNRESVAEFCRLLDVRTVVVDCFSGTDFKQLLQNEDADLGILYGTNIIRPSVFSIPEMGSINIHQGLAPYYRGGPTVFWELFNGEDQVGITVHFVAPEVDTGEIVLQKTVPLNYDFEKYGLDYEEFLKDFRASMVEPSAELMARAVDLIANGDEERTVQDISIGKRYRLPTRKEKARLIRRLRRRLKREISDRGTTGLPPHAVSGDHNSSDFS